MGENVYSLGERSTGLLHGHLHEPLLWLINGPEGLDLKAAKYDRVNQRLYKQKTFLCWEFGCFNMDEGRERAICTQQIKTFSCMKFHTHPMANALLINSLLNLIKEI